MKPFYIKGLAMLCLMLLSISNLSAQNQRIPFQGTLYEAGVAVNTPVNITFTIADPAWTETHSNVSVTQGVYAVVLGDMTAFPDDMFTTGTPQMVINIGGTDVATVDLHAPYISEAIVHKNMPSQINRTFDEDGSEWNGLTVLVDGSGDAQTAALEGVAQSTTQNTGVEGFAVSGAGNVDTQNGLYGQAAGDGTGNHRGVMGYGAGAGKYNHGLKGYAAGDGNGDAGQGFGEGSINFGVEGNATGNAWNNTGIEGSNFGTEGVWNFGVHGISNAGTGTAVENHGVAGRAYGPGKNIGIYGTAADGNENFAGVFDGDVNINGELMVNGESLTSLTSLPDTLNAVNETTTTGRHSAVEGISKTTGWNSGVEGYAESLSGNVEKQNGVYGTATGTGEGDHRGVVGTAAGAGKYNKGIFGIGQGAGNGDEGFGFGEGSINFGVEGVAGGNAWSNTGIEGSTFGDDGRVNYGVHGISNAGTMLGADTVENYGLAGRAYGIGKNYGVYGGAGDGTVNYAGYFDGDVNINGALTVNGETFNPSGGGGDASGVFDSIQIQNANDEVRAKLTSYDNGGLDLYDRLGEKTFELMSNDTASHFFMYNERIRSSNGNRYPGFWMKNYDWGTYFQMVGIPAQDDPDWEKLGEAYIQAFSDGASLTMGAGNEGKVRLRAGEEYGQINVYSNEWKSSLQLGGKFWEGRPDLGYMAVYGSPDTLDMIMMQATSYDDGSPQEMGEITLNGTDGSSFTINSHGLGKSANGVFGTETNDYVNIGAKEWEGNNGDQRGFIHLSGTDDGLPNGDTQRVYLEVDDYGSGSFGVLGLKNYQDDGGGNGLTTIRLNGENGDISAEGNIASRGLEVNDPTGVGSARVGMAGPNGDEALVSLWKNGNELVLLNTFDDGSERGHISVSSSTNGTSVDIDGNGNIWMPRTEIQSNWGTDGQGAMILKDASDNWRIQASVDDDGSSNYHGYMFISNSTDQSGIEMNGSGRIDFKNASNGGLNALEMGQSGDAGFINLNDASNSSAINMDGATGNFWTRKAELISNWGNSGNQGAFLMRDANDDQQVRFSVDDDGSGNYWGHLELNTNLGDDSRMNISPGGINLGVNPYDNGIVMNYDNSGGPVFEMHSGSNLQASINGTNGDASFARNVSMGNGSVTIGNPWWVSTERGVIYLDGTVDAGITDKGRATLEVRNDGAGSYGHLLLRNYVDAGGGSPTYTVELNGENGDASFNGTVNAGGDVNGANVNTGNVNASDVNATSFIHSDGNVQSGTFDGATGTGVMLFSYGDIDLSQNLNAGGNVNATDVNYSGSLNATSDARFKKNVKSIDNALAKTQQLNGYTYNWNKLAKKQKGIESKEEQVGVLAQELEAVFPQLVKTDDEGYKAVNYAALTAVLIEAVKELSEQVTNLQGENAELKAELTKVDELEIKIDLIQKLLAKQAMTGNEATASR